MSLFSTTPAERDGQLYDKLAVNLAISPLFGPDGYKASLAVVLTPFRDTEAGPESLPDQQRLIVHGDAIADAANDAALAQFMAAIEAAGQQYITAKGI